MNLLLIIIVVIFSSVPALALQQLCPGIIFSQDDDLEFSDTEKRLMCGDRESAAYQLVPAYQARFFLTGFLQSRGYLNPEFLIEDNILQVKIGRQAKVDKVSVTAAVPEEQKKIKKEIRRRFRRMVLNPKLLNSIEAEALSLLRQHSYACAKVKGLVDASDAAITLDLENLTSFKFGPIDKEDIPDVDEDALERFYAMKPEQEFNERKLALTEKRFIRSFVVQGTYFREKCQDDQFSLSQQFLLGPPRTLRYGVGASTEVGPMARIRWSHHRYGSRASQMDANLQASLITQSLRLSANNYHWHHKPRRSLLTVLELKRENQTDFSERSLQLSPLLQWTRDTREHHWIWAFGPSYSAGTFDFDRSNLTRSFSNIALMGRLQWMNHDYELYDIHPEEGDQFNSSFDFRHPRLGFVDPLLKLDTSYVRFHRLTYWGRGSAIGGIRLNAATTWVGDSTNLSNLPPSVKFYGGGSDDIRGFQLRSLPENGGLGALTQLSAKLEFRRTNIIRDNLEVFAFLDGGYFGDRSWFITQRLYYSPGAGIRWLSPIGLVQGFLARGFSTSPRTDFGNRIFLGMGGTF